MGQGFCEGEIYGGVAGNEGEWAFVEVEAQIVAAGGRAEHYEAHIGSHWDKAEVEPTGGYFIKIVGVSSVPELFPEGRGKA